MSLVNKISSFLCVPEDEIELNISKAQNSYKKYRVKKRNGTGYRTIFHPSYALKAIQYSIIHIYLKDLPIHKIAYAYNKGLKSPLKRNAELHAKYKTTVRIDFENFFESIKFDDVLQVLRKNNVRINSRDEKRLEKIIFPKRYISDGLPIGAPISPIISNLVMYDLDEQILQISKDINSNSSISRYADDIHFSCDKISDCYLFTEEIKTLISDNETPSLTLNERKTHYMPVGSRRTITGLIITPENKVSIGREKKRYIKKLINDFKNGALKRDNISHLVGNLAFILDVEPEFYNSLVMKYGNIVNKIKRNDVLGEF